MKFFFRIIIFFIVVVVLQSLPIFFLKNKNMDMMESKNIILYYDPVDKDGAESIFETVNNSFDRLEDKLNFHNEKKIKVYCYSKQKDLHIRKFGYLTLLINVDWYIGDNRKNKALIVSPNIKTSSHSRENILGAANHEIVHTMNYLKNRKLSYFLNNGIAEYLSHPGPEKDFFKQVNFNAPKKDYFKIKDQLKFGNTGGYVFSYIFVEFIDKNYGWDYVVRLIENDNYEEVFHKSFDEIYDEWVDFMMKNYS